MPCSGATGPSVTLSRAGHPLCGLGGGGPWGGAAPNSESVIVYNCIIIDSSCIVERVQLYNDST